MRLIKLKLKNFRCYGNEEVVVKIDDFTAFIGANSSGKTAALEALEILFSPISSKREIHHTDFHLDDGEEISDVDSRNLHIEAVFEFNELKVPKDGERTIPPYFDSVVVENGESFPILRIRLIARWRRSAQANGNVEQKIVYVLCPESEIEGEYDFHPASRAELSLIQVIYVPAVRNPKEQLRSVGGSLMNQFVGSINWSQKVRSAVEAGFEAINKKFHREAGVKALASAIKKEWMRFASGGKYSNADLSFNSGNFGQAVRNSAVLFSPGVESGKSEIESIGDGLRSLFYLSFASVFVEMQGNINSGKLKRNKDGESPFDIIPPVLIILEVEEPENHVAPHLLGQEAINLIDISKNKGAQVLISSHSASIIKRVVPQSIRHFRFDSAANHTVVRRITLPEQNDNAEKYVRCAVRSYPELYFSRLVVLCEGDSEGIVLPRMIAAMSKGGLDENSISVVPLGGRHVNHFWRLLNDIGIPYVTLLDLDLGREGGGYGRVKYVLDNLLALGEDGILGVKDVDGSPMSKDCVADFLSRDYSSSEFFHWRTELAKRHVYFSEPLDLDYAMLKCFKDAYTKLDSGSFGPTFKNEDGVQVRIRDIEKRGEAIPDTLAEERTAMVLKGNGDSAFYEGGDDKSLMCWYAYLFLGKGKPATHIKGMLEISDKRLVSGAPEFLKDLVKDVITQLRG